jgi:hypothetical protein
MAIPSRSIACSVKSYPPSVALHGVITANPGKRRAALLMARTRVATVFYSFSALVLCESLIARANLMLSLHLAQENLFLKIDSCAFLKDLTSL